MKIKEIDNNEFMKWETVFPREGTPEFEDRIIQMSKNLNNNIFAYKIHQELKPKRGHRKKTTIFYLFIFLCLERPWEKGWEYYLDAKKEKKVNDKINKILHRLPGNFDEYQAPNPSIIKKYLEQRDFQRIVEWSAMNPEILVKMFQPFAKRAFKFQKAMGMTLKRLNKIDFEYANKHWKLIKRFIKLVSQEKNISKSYK